MEKQLSRTSILKRKSLNKSVADNSMPDIDIAREERRVSFARNNFVKPFAADPEKNTIWDNTYEEEAADNTDYTKSSENIDIKTTLVNVLEVSNQNCFSKTSLTQNIINEYEKENYLPVYNNMQLISNTTLKDMDLTRVAPTKESITLKDMDLTCVASTKANTTLKDMDLTCVPSSKTNTTLKDMELSCVHSPILNDMDLTCVTSNKANPTFKDMDLTCVVVHKANATLENMDFTCVTSTNAQTSLKDMDFTCVVSPALNVMDFTCEASNKSNATLKYMDLQCLASSTLKDRAIAPVDSNETNATLKDMDITNFCSEENNLEAIQQDIEITCSFPNPIVIPPNSKPEISKDCHTYVDITSNIEMNGSLQKLKDMELTTVTHRNSESTLNEPIGLTYVIKEQGISVSAKRDTSSNQGEKEFDGTFVVKKNISRSKFIEMNDSKDADQFRYQKQNLKIQDILLDTPGTSFALILNDTPSTNGYRSRISAANYKDDFNNPDEDQQSQKSFVEFFNKHETTQFLLLDTSTPMIGEFEEILTTSVENNTNLTENMQPTPQNNIVAALLPPDPLKQNSLYAEIIQMVELIESNRPKRTHFVDNFETTLDSHNIPVQAQETSLIKEIDEVYLELKELVQNKLSEIKMNLVELETLETTCEESTSNNGETISNNTVNCDQNEDIVILMNLEEEIKKAAERSGKCWTFYKCQDHRYAFYTFYKAVPFMVHIAPNSKIVVDVEPFTNLNQSCLPLILYEAQWMVEKLKMVNLHLVLGNSFDLFTLLDYVSICMEELEQFDKNYMELEKAYCQSHKLKINSDFSISIAILSVEYLIWWDITAYLSLHNLGEITSVKAQHNPSTKEPVKEDDIRKIASNNQGPNYIKNFIENINAYVKKEGKNILLRRDEEYRTKYKFL